MGQQEYQAGANMAFKAFGISDQMQQRQMMQQLQQQQMGQQALQMQLIQAQIRAAQDAAEEETKKRATMNVPVESVIKEETKLGVNPFPIGAQPSGPAFGLPPMNRGTFQFPPDQFAQMPTGRREFSPPPGTSLKEIGIMQPIVENFLGNKGDFVSIGAGGSINIKTGERIDPFQKTEPPMTPYQRESLELRRSEGEEGRIFRGQESAENRALREQEGKENRALREQMHQDNLAMRKDMVSLLERNKNRLPPTAIKDISSKVAGIDRYVQLIDSFKDEFAGSYIGGPTLTGIYSKVGVKGERVDWWKEWLFLDTKIRNEYFGATLTPNEQKAWDAITISENTDPDTAKRAMQSRLKIAKGALDREVEGYSAAGYNVNMPGTKSRFKIIEVK